MQLLKKRRNAQSGFTLVELVVVIAILAILSAVAIPTYSGYIRRAKMANDMQILSSVNSAVSAVAAAEGKAFDLIQISNTGIIAVKNGEEDVFLNEKSIEALLGYTLNEDGTLEEQFQSGWGYATSYMLKDGTWQWTLDDE